MMMTMSSGCSMMTSKMKISKMMMCFLANYMTDGIIKKILVKMLGKSFIETGKLVNVLSFLGYLPCAFPIIISDQAKNGLFIAFSRSNSFGVLEHNALLDALAHPVKGLNLFEYDELGFDLINNAKIQ